MRNLCLRNSGGTFIGQVYDMGMNAKMKTRISTAICITLIALAVLPGDADAAVHQSSDFVSFQNGKMSIQASKTPFLPLMEEISRKANLSIFLVDKDLPERVSVNIRNVTVEQALRRVLNGYNYAVIFSAFADDGGVYVGRHLVPLIDKRLMIALANDPVSLTGSKHVNVSRNAMQRSTSGHAGLPAGGDDSPGDAYSHMPAYRNGSGSGPVRPASDGDIAGAGPSSVEGGTVSASATTSAGGSAAWNSHSASSGHSANTASSGGNAFNSLASGSEGGPSGPTPATGVDSGSAASEEAYADAEAAYDDEYENAAEELPPDAEAEDISSENDEISARERFLLTQIEILEGQIENGYAERWYEHWSQIKEPKYIETHEEKLAYYQTELEKLHYP